MFKIDLGSNNRKLIKFPFVTYALITMLISIFFLQIIFGEYTGLYQSSITTLWSFGGITRESILQGEWYRSVTSSFLHVDIIHLTLNCLVLYMCGRLLEALIGHAWFFSIYFFSVLGGSLASILFNENLISVGASGAITGIVAASLILCSRIKNDNERSNLQTQLTRMLIPALIPVASSSHGINIDFACHAGGAIIGGLLGFLLLETWWENSDSPRFRKLASVVSILSICAIAISVIQPSLNVAIMQNLMGETLIGKLTSNQNEISEKDLDDLRIKYAKDPRIWYLSAILEYKKNYLNKTDIYLNNAIKQKDMLDSFYFNDGLFEKDLRLFYTLVLLERGNHLEAEKIIKPICKKVIEGDKANTPHEIIHLCNES